MALETMTILTQDRIEGMNTKGIWPKGLLIEGASVDLVSDQRCLPDDAFWSTETAFPIPLPR